MKIGRLEISWNHRPWPRLGAKELVGIDERYEKALASGKRLVLGTLCARSGTMVSSSSTGNWNNSDNFLVIRYLSFWSSVTKNIMLRDDAESESVMCAVSPTGLPLSRVDNDLLLITLALGFRHY